MNNAFEKKYLNNKLIKVEKSLDSDICIYDFLIKIFEIVFEFIEKIKQKYQFFSSS